MMSYTYLPMLKHKNDPDRHTKPVWCVALVDDNGNEERLSGLGVENLTMADAEAKADEMTNQL